MKAALANSHARGLALALVVAWLLSGLMRAVATIALNGYQAFGLERLTLLAISRAWLGGTFVAVAALVALAALTVGWLGGWRRLASWLALALLWLVMAIYEIAELTNTLDVIGASWRFAPAQLWVLAIAGLGLAISGWLLPTLSSHRRAGRAVVAIALLAACGSALAALAAAGSPAGNQRNVLLITVDTLRTDHLSCYGYDRPTSPRLDALARQGVRFARSISQAPSTHPSLASMLTSVYPTQMGSELKYVPYGIPTVAEVFRNGGYQTAAVVSNAWLKTSLGFDQGFAHYDQESAMSEFYADHRRIDWKDASHVSDAALAWLDRHHDRPFFLWIHYLDPHHPYEPQEPWKATFIDGDVPPREILGDLGDLPTGEQTRRLKAMAQAERQQAERQFAAIRQLYDGEIAFTDAQIGRVLDRLRELGIDERTAILFTADHGEEFLDHGSWGHSHTLHDELIHVPLILRYPDQPRPGSVDERLVRTLDVSPTLLAIAGLTPPRTMLGSDLTRIEQRRKDPPALSIMTKGPQYSYERDGWKLIYDHKNDRRQLFDLRRDPAALDDLAAVESERAAQWLAHLQRLLPEVAADRDAEVRDHMLDSDSREQLKALGYID